MTSSELAIDPRRVQRALFLIELSPRWRRALFEAGADASELKRELCLGDDELQLLRGLDPIAIAADRHGKRADQLLGNATSEFPATRALAAEREPAFLDGFLDDAAFQRAILDGTPLPLAFAAYAETFVAERGDAALAALLTLEVAMAELRRAASGSARAPAGAVSLASDARLVELPGGTLERATAIQVALAEDTPLPGGELSPDTDEALLLFVPHRPRHGQPDVTVEPIEPLVAALLHAAQDGLDEDGRDAFAAQHGIERSDLDPFVEELVGDGVLVRGV